MCGNMEGVGKCGRRCRGCRGSAGMWEYVGVGVGEGVEECMGLVWKVWESV